MRFLVAGLSYTMYAVEEMKKEEGRMQKGRVSGPWSVVGSEGARDGNDE